MGGEKEEVANYNYRMQHAVVDRVNDPTGVLGHSYFSYQIYYYYVPCELQARCSLMCLTSK